MNKEFGSGEKQNDMKRINKVKKEEEK